MTTTPEQRARVGATPRASTLTALLDDAAARFGDNLALVVGAEASVTYRELRDRVEGLAGGLARCGVGPGDRVATWLPNSVEFVVVLFAAARLGAVLVPLNTRYQAEEAAYVLAQSGARALVFRDRVASADLLRAVLDLCPGALAPTGLLSERLPHLALLVAAGSHPGRIVPFAALMAGGGGRPARVRPADTALIQYTSGTTAFPKGVMLSHANLTRAGSALAAAKRVGRDDRLFSALPFFHTAGTVHALATCFSAGTPLITLPTFDAAESLRLMARHGCTCQHAVDTVILRQLEHEAADPLRALKKVWVTGGPAFLERLQALGIGMVGSLYGMTETTGNSTIARPDDPPSKRLATVGRPLPGVEVEVRDPDTGEPGDPASPGEIHVRGWNVMSGYFGQPEATAAVLRPGGWLRTGDRGCLDAAGYLRWLGRIKEIIRVGGENVSPEEVERVLEGHPTIQQACVVGAPDARLGEVGVAFIRPAPGCAPVEQELLAYLRQRLAGFKVPQRVQAIDEFPLTVTNKVRRVELRERARQLMRIA